VNTNVQPAILLEGAEAKLVRRRKSTQSNNSDDSDVGWLRLSPDRNLEYWGDEPENFQNMEDAPEAMVGKRDSVS